MTDVHATKDKVLNDFNEVVADTEKLLKSVQSAGGEKAHALRETLEQKVKAARERLEQLEAAVAGRARATAKATDEYVHGHPWQSIGIAAAIAGVIGVVVGLLLNRR